MQLPTSDPGNRKADDTAEILLSEGSKALAHRRGVSLRTLRRRFSSRGVTLQGFRSAHRAALTLNLLQEPNARLNDVAVALGFSSGASFIRFVKREFGKTPGALRDELSVERPGTSPSPAERTGSREGT
jgi:AraC-like DNA-binding protein